MEKLIKMKIKVYSKTEDRREKNQLSLFVSKSLMHFKNYFRILEMSRNNNNFYYDEAWAGTQ